MKLRTLTGTRWPATCADGCGTRIPPGAEVKVVVDFDSRPRKTWIPEHSPDAGTWRKDPPKEEAKTSPPDGFQPASALLPAPVAASLTPASSSRAQPSADEASLRKATAPLPSASTRAPLAFVATEAPSDPTPSPQSGAAWATSQVTFNAGPYESAKAGFADYALPGESGEQLRARVHRVVLADLENQVRAMRDLHERLGDTPRALTSRAGTTQSA